MQQAIFTTPNTVYVEASQPVFQQYTSGVITSSTCGTSTDHAILAVGYTTSATNPTSSSDNYWIIENSWGATWGNAGYLYIGMATGAGICGVNTGVYYPFVQQPV
jgi:C1A family cysteine protease